MKKLQDYSEDIYKCTKCGLCQSACPIFEHTGLECAVSRGKFTLLNGVIKGDLELSPKVSSYLDLCLSCNACTDYCPSGINAEEILTLAKYEAFKKGHTNPLKNIIITIFNSKLILQIIRIMLFFYRNLFIGKIAETSLPAKTQLGKKIRLFNQWIKINVKYKPIPQKINNKINVVYFPGCINTYINPSVMNAVKMVFEANGISYTIPEFDCCGIPARNIGDIKSFKQLAIKNLEQIPDNIDYLITDCASCGSVWNLYSEILEGEQKQKATKLAQKSINLYTLLSKLELHIPEYKGEKQKVTYHDPCHLIRSQNVSKEPRAILKKLPNVEFIEMKDHNKCCGAAGSFIASHQKISKQISAQKGQNIIDAKADIASTSCPSCNLGIIQGLLEHNKTLLVAQPVELLSMLYSKS